MTVWRRISSSVEVIWEAVNDQTARLRYISGQDAKELLNARFSLEQDESFLKGMRERFGLT